MVMRVEMLGPTLALTTLLAAAPWFRCEAGAPTPPAAARGAQTVQVAEARSAGHVDGYGALKSPPALYTRKQARSGRKVFEANCAACHGPNLEGRSGPALKGSTFATPAANFKVRDVFTFLSQNMPAYAPGSLSHEDYVEVMAFLLQQNGYPAGRTPLTYETAGASMVPLICRVSRRK